MPDGATDASIPDAATETCGDGQLDEPEECDDANVVTGDGCSTDCRIERVRWIDVFPGELSIFHRKPLSEGRLAIVPDDTVEAQELRAPRLLFIEGDGSVEHTVDFGLKAGSTLSVRESNVTDDDSVQLVGTVRGESSLTGNTGGVEEAFLTNFDRVGNVRSGAPFDASTLALRRFTRQGDFLTVGEFGSEPFARVYNSSARAPTSPGVGFFFLSADIDFANETRESRAFGFSFSSVRKPGSNIFSWRVQDAQQSGSNVAILWRDSFRVYDAIQQEMEADSQAMLVVSDSRGRKVWNYSFPTPILDGRVVYLKNGEVLADVSLDTYSSPAPVQDATGQQSLTGRSVFWFTADGELLLARPGSFLAQRGDGAVVVRKVFNGTVSVPSVPPVSWTATPDGFAMYLATYARDGTVKAARRVESWTEDSAPLLAVEDILVGETGYVAVHLCNERTLFGEPGFTVAPPPGGLLRSLVRCLLRVDFDGRVRWVRPLGEDLPKWRLAVDGDRTWSIEGPELLRLDSRGHVDFNLNLGNVIGPAVHVRDGHVWITGDLPSYGPPDLYMIAPFDPLAKTVTVTAPHFAVVKVRN